MSLYRYFQPVSGLPDQNGPLSGVVSSEAIAAANREVQNSQKKSKKRGSYRK